MNKKKFKHHPLVAKFLENGGKPVQHTTVRCGETYYVFTCEENSEALTYVSSETSIRATKMAFKDVAMILSWMPGDKRPFKRDKLVESYMPVNALPAQQRLNI